MAKIATVRSTVLSCLLSLISVFLLASCDDGVKPAAQEETLSKGSISISVDETYQPVIEQQIHVFDSMFPEAHISVSYKPEAECIRDLLERKARLVLVTRPLTAEESNYLAQRKMVPDSMKIARDAIAVIINKASKDTLIDGALLRGILSGQYKQQYTVVVDHQGSSMLRFLKDSVMAGAALGSNVYAAGNNDSVINYVASNPNAIGFVGLSHISTEVDPMTGSFDDRIRVAAVQNPADKEFYKPYQAYIADKSYPLSRNLYYIKAETYAGLGRGFTNFLADYQGQLIFKKHHLFPLRVTVVIRDVNVNR